MNKVLRHISFYIQKYPARLSGYISAIVLNVSHLYAKFPIGLLIPTAMILIMFGEGSQRMEDGKTLQALYTENDPKKSDEEILIEMLKKVHDKGHEKGHDNGITGTH
jgi:hypothetical protein